VVLGEPDAAVGVAAVDDATGEVTHWATLPGTGPHELIDADTAKRLAGMPLDGSAELVWESHPGSRSPLYPLWRITAEGRTVYVDQQSRVWPPEAPARGG
jgi:hypothetical protein